MKTLTINNEIFTVHKSKNVSKFDATRCDGCDLYDYYVTPSYTKQKIWNYWEKWSREVKTTCFGVSSGCSHFFTIKGLYETGNETYLLVITASYNKAYLL